MIYALRITLTDLEEAQTLRALIEELGYTVELQQLSGQSHARSSDQWASAKAIFDTMRPGRSYCAEDFAEIFMERGFNPISSSALLCVLNQDGKITRVARGVYRLNEGEVTNV